jgi:TPP-dependent pyruvate/acetoin dehydrogenase alpha subunit
MSRDALNHAEPSVEDLLAMYRDMVLLRTFDERCVVYHRQGRMGPAPLSYGHEALQVGAFHALRENDWIFPSYRETALARLRGMPFSVPFAQWRGHPHGWWDPQRYRTASACIAVGTQVPHAAGFAWGQRLAGGDDATLVFFGDGATSEGAFHEGVNFASVFRVPLVLLCNNNGWAISTPLERQTRATRLVDKAAGYGMPGERVDGHDVAAVHEAVRRALARARAGDGPTFIEAVTVRIKAHGTADDDSRYRDTAELQAEEEGEGLARLERRLLAAAVLTPEDITELKEQAVAEVKSAMLDAEALPPPDPALIHAHVFAQPSTEPMMTTPELLVDQVHVTGAPLSPR